MEYQAVIMAAGRGSRMTDLTNRTQKPLLPIANRPMIWYPANMLMNAGFANATIVIQKSVVNDVQKALKELTARITFEYVVLSDDHDKGTADSLREIQKNVKADLLVVSCDLVTQFPLQLLADVHRTNDATITVLLTPSPNISETAVPCPKSNRYLEKDVIGLDESHKRLLYCVSESDLEHNISFKMCGLQRFPYVELHTNLLDAHLYIMKREVLDVPELSSHSTRNIKADFLPYLISQQYSSLSTAPLHTVDTPSGELTSLIEDSRADVSTLDDTKIESYIREMSTWSDGSSSGADGVRNQTAVKCCACIVSDGSVCLRANTLVTYCEANRQIAASVAMEEEQTTRKAQLPRHAFVDAGSIIGEGVTLMEKVGIKSSVIGNNCEIGALSKITNCIIMDNVKIGAGVKLTGSVVCEKACISDKAELVDCLVCGTEPVPGGKKYTNEVVMLERDQMMEI